MLQTVKRRDFLERSVGSLLAMGLWPGALRAQDNGQGGAFSFIAVNDTHYIDEQCGEFLAKVMAQMKATTPKPDFVLIAGDLCDHGTVAELGGAREVYKTLGLPYHVVIGNHDYVSPIDRKPYEDHFPKSLDFRFEHKGWQIVGLDTSEGQKYNNTTVQPHTIQWLDEQVPKLDRAKPTVVFTHFPLGPMTPTRPLNADVVLERFKDLNLQAVFNGHFHGFTERMVGKAVVTTNRCCALKRNNHDGTREKGYFVCVAKDGKIARTFVEVKAT